LNIENALPMQFFMEPVKFNASTTTGYYDDCKGNKQSRLTPFINTAHSSSNLSSGAYSEAV